MQPAWLHRMKLWALHWGPSQGYSDIMHNTEFWPGNRRSTCDHARGLIGAGPETKMFQNMNATSRRVWARSAQALGVVFLAANRFESQVCQFS